MSFEEKTIESCNIYTGKIIDVQLHEVKLPNGKTSKREIVLHSGAVAIIPIDSYGKIIFVKQFRKAVEEELTEIPAGKLEKGEMPEICANRELMEETGYKANKLTYLASIYTTPGFSNEIVHIYKAEDLVYVGILRDEDEFIELDRFSIQDALKQIKSGIIKDAKTTCGILMLALDNFNNNIY